MILYVDELLLLNLLVNYLLLLACGRLIGGEILYGRLLLGAVLGAVYALGALLPSLGFLLSWIMKAVILVGMILTAYGHCTGLWRYAVLLLVLSSAYAGAVYLAGTVLGARVCVRNGIVCYPVSYRAMLLTLCLTYGAVSLILRCKLSDTKRQVVPLVLSYRERSVHTTALIDTGNELRDPINGQGVVIVESDVIGGLLEAPVREVLKKGSLSCPAELFVKLKETAPELHFRLFSFQSLGAGGLLLALDCDAIQIGADECPCRWAAMTETRLSALGEYHALAPEQKRGRYQ